MDSNSKPADRTTCKLCGSAIPLDAAAHCHSRRMCKPCINKEMRERRAVDADTARARDRRDYEKNRARKLEIKRAQCERWRELVGSDTLIVCTKCGVEKHSSEYTRNSRLCSPCRKAGVIEYRLRDVERHRKYEREWKVASRKKNPSLVREMERRSRSKSTAEKKIARSKSRVKHCRDRRGSDPKYRLTCRMRARMWGALKLRPKSGKTFDLIGCSPSELVKHLELQFTDGMSWDNYGLRGWHVDHIKPCYEFNLGDPVQQRACFHYTNLRPLWWTDNLARNKKVFLSTPVVENAERQHDSKAT